jgi:hypothetical protein
LIQGKIESLKLRKTTNFSSKTQFFPESMSRKHFQGSRMRGIDSRIKLPPEGLFLEQYIFRSQKSTFLAHPV